MFSVEANKDFVEYQQRRGLLVARVREQFPDKKGVIVLFAGFENERTVFRQESSFYYLTGLEEPGLVLTVDLEGFTRLYVPNCGAERSKWLTSSVDLSAANAHFLGIDEIVMLGDVCPGYQFYPFFTKDQYLSLLEMLGALVSCGETIFTFNPDNAHQYIEQRLVLERLKTFVPGLAECIADIAPLVARMRRTKSMHEIELLYQAVELTMSAHGSAAHMIEDGVAESEVQAAAEYIMTGSGAKPSFPSIVAGGKNGTVLHYTVNKDTLKDGDLVVVDIGAEVNYYCGDLTRTYPVSGTFTARQRELYEAVLETQEYIANIAGPGMWLSNNAHPEKSLNHLARAFLAKRGLDTFFTHGIGHFLGLDVHDEGDRSEPLAEGDVITIEPGVYIPQEGIGIRIEDNYWVVKDGVVCLSEQLPKTPEDIEEFLAQGEVDEQQGCGSDHDHTEH